jgi:drug/metabolite transporter (DMT)-like permease
MGFGDIVMLIITVLTGSVGQYFLKMGANKLGAVTGSNFVSHILGIAMIPELLVGLTCYAGAAVLYILILTRVPLSVLAPSVALQYVIAVLVGKYAFRDVIPGYRWFGLGMIIGGVVLVIWNKKPD